MSSWVSVTQSGRRRDGSQLNAQGACGNGTHGLLAMFKTRPCPNSNNFHDHRQCEYYHSKKDMRRNPYAEFYLPDDDDILSSVEVSYHPTRYLTKLCGQTRCAFGKCCAWAHGQHQVRNATAARQKYSEYWSNKTLESKA